MQDLKLSILEWTFYTLALISTSLCFSSLFATDVQHLIQYLGL